MSTLSQPVVNEISSNLSSSLIVGFGATTVVLFLATLYLSKSSRRAHTSTTTSAGDDCITKSSTTTASTAGNNNHNGGGGRGGRQGYDREKYPGGQISIYYGSQTGTAQMFAKQLGAECENRGFVCSRIVDIQDVTDNTTDSVQLVAGYDMNEEGGEESDSVPQDLDDDGVLLRASLAHPTFRDVYEQQQHQPQKEYGRSKAIFLVATYGEGEPTDSTSSFVDIMKRMSGITNIHKLPDPTDGATEANDDEEEKKEENYNNATTAPASFLRDVDYAVFGLGNKQYEHFNNMGRFVDVALAKCGATRVAKLGLGDDDDDLEGDFDNWKENVLWPSFMDRYVDKNLVFGGEEDMKKKMDSVLTLPSCPYTVEYCVDVTTRSALNENIQSSSKLYTQAVDCPISFKKELRDPTDTGSTLHIEIDISKHMDMMAYHTADNLGIFPRNDSSIVKDVADALHLDLDKAFYLVPNNNTNTDGGGSNNIINNHALPFPTPCTVRDCLEQFCDLTGSPRRSDLKQLATYATSDLDRKALLRMSTKEGKAEYRQKIVDSHVGVADIVTKLCTSIVCPLEHFIMICPRLQPRYYTISSSSLVNPTTIHITLAVLETTSKDERIFRGLTSNYLAKNVNIGDTVSAFVRESTFRLKDRSRPLLMFGPGTGIAPMRAFLQERSYMRNTTEQIVGSSILYFGCKKRTMDYIYRDELESYVTEGTLTQLHLAFSREKTEKVYVQHLLVNNAVETWKLIHDDKASIFVCGEVRMGADVGSTLQDIISDQGGLSREKAKAYLDNMAVAGRYVQELWS